jgi:hypothetical protein
VVGGGVPRRGQDHGESNHGTRPRASLPVDSLRTDVPAVNVDGKPVIVVQTADGPRGGGGAPTTVDPRRRLCVEGQIAVLAPPRFDLATEAVGASALRSSLCRGTGTVESSSPTAETPRLDRFPT